MAKAATFVQPKLDSSKLIAQAEIIAGAFADMGHLCQQISNGLLDAVAALQVLDRDSA